MNKFFSLILVSIFSTVGVCTLQMDHNSTHEGIKKLTQRQVECCSTHVFEGDGALVSLDTGYKIKGNKTVRKEKKTTKRNTIAGNFLDNIYQQKTKTRWRIAFSPPLRATSELLTGNVIKLE